jgi:hypothetical protein
VRLAFFGAAVVAALVIPGLVRAGDPRLTFEIRPPVTLVLENGGGRDALLTIDARNPGDRRVRVERVRLTYFKGDTAVGTLDPATSIFTQAGLLSDPRVDPGGLDRWEGLCLAPPTSATDRVRLDFDLVERRELRRIRAKQSLDVPLQRPVDPPVIALPFIGTWRVTQGHTCETNHRRGRLGGQFSWDFVAVSDTGHLGAPEFDTSHRNDDSETFGRPVISPVTGTVVSFVDGVDDNDGQKSFPRRSLTEATHHPRWFFGNHIVLDAGEGVYVLLAHLKKDSVVVKPGAIVHQGDPIAQAGNSGNTMLPHVHIQVMDGADPAGASVSGIPALFGDYVEIISDGERIERETIVRRMTSGDPPVDSIVLTPAPPRRPHGGRKLVD